MSGLDAGNPVETDGTVGHFNSYVTLPLVLRLHLVDAPEDGTRKFVTL